MARVRLSTPRQEATARRNKELRDLKNEILERDASLDFAQKMLELQKRREDRMDLELNILRATPVDLIRTVFEAVTVSVAIEAGVLEECQELHRWLKRFRSVEDAEKELQELQRNAEGTSVATGNGGDHG